MNGLTAILAAQNNQTTYYSYTTQLDNGKTPWDYLQTGNLASFGERFFWQSADKQVSVLGVGALLEFNGEEATFEEVSQGVTKLKKQLMECHPAFQEQTLLCGAFSFDSLQKQEAQWGDLNDGYFFLPEILIQAQGSVVTLTLTIQGKSKTELTQGWQSVSEQLELLEKWVPNHDQPSPGQLHLEAYLTEAWAQSVTDTAAMLKESPEMEKVVLARQMAVTSQQPFQAPVLLARLNESQPLTYLFYLEKAGTAFIGATPERLLAASDGQFATAAIAGSTPRGGTDREDQELGDALLADCKNRQEHQIVVDRLLRELSPLTTEPIHVPEVGLLKNRDIQHLYVPLSIQRKNQLSFVEALQRLHPTPALGGEPKTAALGWIRQVEPVGRGLYGAPIGWLRVADDTGEFAVGIRSGVFQGKQGLLYAGCGVVPESIAELEVAETAVKFKPMLRGVGIK